MLKRLLIVFMLAFAAVSFAEDGLRIAHGGVETQGGILLFENLRGAEEVRQEARDFRPTGARQEDDEIRIAVFRLACVGGQRFQ